MNSAAMMQAPVQNTPAVTAAAQTNRKRRRRAPPSGASEDCHTCRSNGRPCDRKRPYCGQCIETDGTCSGYRTQLTWGVGVASRGKLRGLSLPVPLTEEERAKRNAAPPAEKKEEKKKLKISTGASTGAGVTKSTPTPSSAAAASSLSNLRNMNYDFVNMENANSQARQFGHQQKLSYGGITSHPQMFSPQNSQFQKIMHNVSAPQQSSLSLLLSPTNSEFSTQSVMYHPDSASTGDVYSPLYSPVDLVRSASDGGFLHSPVEGSFMHSHHMSHHRSHPHSIPTSVPDHVNELFEDDRSCGQPSPSLNGSHRDGREGNDGELSALLYDEDDMLNMYHNNGNGNSSNNNQNGSGQTHHSPASTSSPVCSPSPPPLMHSTASNSSYYYAYSPSSPTELQTPPPMSGMQHMHHQQQLHLQGNSYPPTPNSLSPSTPTTPLMCGTNTPPPMSVPTSSPGNTMALTTPALLLQQQLLQNSNAMHNHMHNQNYNNYHQQLSL